MNEYLKLYERVSVTLDPMACKEFYLQYQPIVDVEGEFKIDEAEAIEFYTYFVPKVAPDGLTRTDELEDLQFDLRGPLGIERIESLADREETHILFALHRLLDAVMSEININWLGVLVKLENINRGPGLLKLASVGREARAFYPLTEAFARRSNSAAAGMTARPVVINDMAESLARDDGPYSPYDETVKSEAALPIVSDSGDLLGVLDAESSLPNTFQGEVLHPLIGACKACAPLLERLRK